MPDRPSEPLLAFLRDTIKKRGLSVSVLAGRIGRERAPLRRALAGQEPLTVDDFVLLSNALELTPAELGLQATAEAAAAADPDEGETENGAEEVNEVRADAPIPLRVAAPAPPPEPEVDPELDEPDARRVLRLGFELGVDMFVLFDPTQLGESGVPAPVLAQFKERLPITFEARHHRHNRPRYEPEAFTCVLSFDKLYTCTFPWTAFREVRFTLAADAPTPPPPPAPEPARRPALRLVK